MTPVAMVLAGLAAWLAFPPPLAGEMTQRLGTDAEQQAAAARNWVRPLLPWLAAVTLMLGAATIGGGRGTAVAAAGLIVLATTARLLRSHRRTRASLRARAEVAHACSLLASQLRVGRVPAEALRSAAEDCPVLDHAAQVVTIGGDPTSVWATQARAPGHQGLAELSRAWQVSTRTGAPLAASLEGVAEALTEDTALRRLVAGELSAPRATGKIMAVLPLLGIGIGYAIGGDPVEFLLGSPAGWLCLVAGAGLAALGVLWIEALAQRAAEVG